LAGCLTERLVEQEGIDVTEAQDYEAPLYYFLLRRALGLGPKRHPPCLIHLHSPTEFIVRYNDWHMAQPAFLLAKQMEDYSISAADALLCPSRFLARQAENHYELRQNSVKVIPYPLGRVAKVERDAATWSNGSVCYVGRLERRKGTLEWIEAAVEVARQNASTTFEFVGTNILASNPILSEAVLNGLIPRHLKGQFVFHGNLTRAVIPLILKRARIAVVPSRWENFPNTCMEAMASGLPIIATPSGGTVEMLDDGQTGWIAEESNSAGLRKALVRALETSPLRLAEMGGNAVRSIGKICDNQAIIERHLTFRKHLAGRGAKSPLAQPLPKSLSARQYRGQGVECLDVFSDYETDGLNLTDGSSSAKTGSSSSMEHFRQLVVADTQRSSALPFLSHTVTGRGWVGKLSELLATVKCLIVNPKLTFRVLQQFASE
jgi:glycogen synthase